MREKFKIGIYNVGIIREDVNAIFGGKTYTIQWMKHSYSDRFFADPFLYRTDSQYYYILAEEFCFYENIGKISLLTVSKSDFRLEKKKVLIQEKYHLSFPYYEDGWIYPEAYRSGGYYRYKIDGDKIMTKEKVSESALIDPIPYADKRGNWLFAMKEKNPLSDLYLLQKNGQTTMYEEIQDKPVKQNIKYSRPAGQFFERDGVIYRPVQDSEGGYGKKVHIMRIKQVDEKGLVEEYVTTVSSTDAPPYVDGFHTFNVYNSFVIVDGYLEKYSYIRKPLFVKMPFLIKAYNKILKRD